MRSAALVVLLFVGGAFTITVDGQRAEALFSDYLQAVSSYQRNETSPSALIANLSKADFYKIRQLLQKAEPRLIEAAALLHTEVAMSVSRPETADLQLAFGEAVLNLLPKDFEGTVAFRTRWYRVVPTVYLARRDPEAGRPFIDRGLRAFPADARLRLLSGISYEMTALLHEIICVADCDSRRRRLDLLKWTGFAASEYREALRLDDRLDEAQLRLGRVMALAGKAAEARTVLERALRAADVQPRYLAALFLAALATDRGELQHARSRYESAVTLCPGCQSALVGEAFIDALSGGDAASDIERLFQTQRRTEPDPWIVYQFPQLDSDTLDVLRAEVRRVKRTTAAIVTTLMALPMAPGFAQTTFKSSIELVRLDVSVMRDGRPLRGLTADDFVVTDNDLPQQIQSASLEAAPLNIVMALDASGSVRGDTLVHLIDAAIAVSADLHDDDRGALITFSQSVERPVPLAGDRGDLARALRSLNGSGGTALRDAILVALAQTQDDDRPTVLLIFSDGRDTASWLTERNLLDVVRRARPVVHAIEIPEGRPAPPSSPLPPGRSPNAAALAHEPSSFLATLARAAGGRYWRAAQPEQLRDVFRAALDEMRTRYELAYYPVKAGRSGWHRLDVRLKRGSATIAARPGYFVP